MGTLYKAGWRQGSMLAATLPSMGIRLTVDGSVAPETELHDQWIVATQDCDLDHHEVGYEADVVELRPVFDRDPPQTRGIRARKFLLTNGQYLESESRRTMISPAALTALVASGVRRDDSIAADPERRMELKTWLGYRYDRPAVPPEYVALATRIAEEVRRRGKAYSAMVRDVFVQFAPGQPPTYYLFAVIMNDDDAGEVLEWLTAATFNIPQDLGVLGNVEAATAEHTSLALLETSFAADTTQVTWSGRGLRGQPGKLSHPATPP